MLPVHPASEVTESASESIWDSNFHGAIPLMSTQSISVLSDKFCKINADIFEDIITFSRPGLLRLQFSLAYAPVVLLDAPK